MAKGTESGKTRALIVMPRGVGDVVDIVPTAPRGSRYSRAGNIIDVEFTVVGETRYLSVKTTAGTLMLPPSQAARISDALRAGSYAVFRGISPDSRLTRSVVFDPMIPPQQITKLTRAVGSVADVGRQGR